MRHVLMSMVVAVACLTACSASPSFPTAQPGVEPPGSAKIAVDGQNPTTTTNVACQPAGSLTFVRTGSDESGATIVISNDAPPTVRSVSLRNLDGFTGSYHDGLGDAAKVTLTGRQYDVSGNADGFTSAAPSFRTSKPFAISVAC